MSNGRKMYMVMWRDDKGYIRQATIVAGTAEEAEREVRESEGDEVYDLVCEPMPGWL